MKLTSRARYAVVAMLDLALYSRGKSVALIEVARRQEIPLSYLGRLLAQLGRRGLVSSQRGPGGGYRLAKPSADISVADVVIAVDGSVGNLQCKTNCQGHQRCLTHDLWAGLGHCVYNFLDGVSLARLAEEREVLESASRQQFPLREDREISLRLDRRHLDGAQI